MSLHLTYCFYLRTFGTARGTRTPPQPVGDNPEALHCQLSAALWCWCFVCETRNSTETRSPHSRRPATSVRLCVRVVVLPVPVRPTAKIVAAGCSRVYRLIFSRYIYVLLFLLLLVSLLFMPFALLTYFLLCAPFVLLLLWANWMSGRRLRLGFTCTRDMLVL